ncbi:MAG: hypothetical protein JRG86_18670 [Deltaproteobacteria bacterium]|nr:hypothetical protein [Deltaproteobacteria bacterium]
MQRLRFDRRLLRRREWVEEAELEAHVEALPDVADKIASDDEAPAAAADPGVPADLTATSSSEPGGSSTPS